MIDWALSFSGLTLFATHRGALLESRLAPTVIIPESGLGDERKPRSRLARRIIKCHGVAIMLIFIDHGAPR